MVRERRRIKVEQGAIAARMIPALLLAHPALMARGIEFRGFSNANHPARPPSRPLFITDGKEENTFHVAITPSFRPRLFNEFLPCRA